MEQDKILEFNQMANELFKHLSFRLPADESFQAKVDVYKKLNQETGGGALIPPSVFELYSSIPTGMARYVYGFTTNVDPWDALKPFFVYSAIDNICDIIFLGDLCLNMVSMRDGNIFYLVTDKGAGVMYLSDDILEACYKGILPNIEQLR